MDVAFWKVNCPEGEAMSCGGGGERENIIHVGPTCYILNVNGAE